jgi:transposase
MGSCCPRAPWRFAAQARAAIAGADLSGLARAIFVELLDELDELDRRMKKLDATMVAFCRTNETCRRLARLPGVGPVVAAVNDGRQFQSGREMAAWMGLVPRQYTTGGKPRLGGIGRRANHYLRRQLIHGARAVVSRLPIHPQKAAVELAVFADEYGFDGRLRVMGLPTIRQAKRAAGGNPAGIRSVSYPFRGGVQA